MADGGVTKELDTKIAGVPAWGIGALLAGGVIVFVYVRNKKNQAEDSATSATDTGTDTSGTDVDPATGLPYADESSYDTGIDSLSGLSTDESAYPVGLTAQGTPAPTTNVQWERLVADELLAKGDDPTLISNALTKYLSGGSLTAAENGIVSLALQMFGAPPEGLLPITPVTPVTPPPVTTTPPPKTTTPPPKTTTPPAKTPQYITTARYTKTNPPWNSTFSGISGHTGVSEATLKSLNKNYPIVPYPGRVRIS